MSGKRLMALIGGILILMFGTMAWSNHQRAERLRVAAEEAQRAADAKAAAEARERQAAAKHKAEQERMEADARTAFEQNATVLDEITRKWDDAVAVSGATARISLNGPVATLQSIRRDAEALSFSSCLEDARKTYVEEMDLKIRDLIAFMRQDDAARLRVSEEQLERILHPPLGRLSKEACRKSVYGGA